MKLIAEMIVSALRTSWRVLVTIVFLLSIAFNVSTAAVGLSYSVVASVVEAVTGLQQAGSVKSKEKVAQKAADDLADASREITKLKSKAVGLGADLDAAKLKASKMEGKAAGLGLRVERAEVEAAKVGNRARKLEMDLRTVSLEGERRAKKVTALEEEVTELAKLKGSKKVMLEGVEVPVAEAVAKVSNRVKTRTAKVASADLGATFGQSIPWIGVGVVVAATAYDLKTACDTMKDMHTLEVALDPSKANDPSVQEVCGLKVPSKEEIWAKVKASPGEAWDWAKDAVPDLPEMPDMPEIDWTPWD